jgi:arylsulfatase A-like enzyme
LIVVDTLRADRVSAYGYGRETTPVLDVLAAQGVLAEDVTAQASWTLPSMVSMFQGRYVTTYRDVFFEDTPTLAETFQRAGYHTFGIVGNGLLSEKKGFDRGFDHYESRSKKEGSHPAREAAELIGDATAPLELATERGTDEEHAPFFAYLHLMDPHGPYKAHPEWEEQLPVSHGADRWTFQTQRLSYDATHPGGIVANQLWREMAEDMARYDQEVYTCDVYIGIVLDYLERRGVLENTIVAVVSDHGEGLWDHVSPPDVLINPRCPVCEEAVDAAVLSDYKGRSVAFCCENCKKTFNEDPDSFKENLPEESPRNHFFRPHGKVLYEELVRTPMILKGPGIPAGHRIESAAENVDLFPTLLELCDLAMPDGLHGQSLVPAMHGKGTGREHSFSSVDMFCSSVRTASEGWKLIVPTEHYPARKIELFDIRTDPSELKNLAGARPEVVARLRATLDEWAAAHPTQTNLGQKKDQQTLDDLKALGYAEGEEDQSD